MCHDTTSLAFNTLRETKGLGPLDGPFSRGLKMHSALVVDSDGVPQGLLHSEVWAREDTEEPKAKTRRKRAIEEKESQRWLTTVAVCEKRLPADVRAWIIGDREADIYELLAMPRREGIELLIRSAHDRRIQNHEARYLRAAVEAAPVLGEIEVELKRTRTRDERTAKLEISLCQVEIMRPKHKTKCKIKSVSASVVWVREIGEVPEGQEPVEWLLVSTKPVTNFEEAVACVEAYVERWKVERYHYTLKSGCQVEKLQLEYAERIERAVALYSIIACRQLQLTYLARTSPDLPCTAVLEEDESQVLHLMADSRTKAPGRPMSVREAVRQIARLGGFLGRKGDGEPGVKVIWRGLRRLGDFVLAFRCLSRAKPDVTNA